MTTCRRCGTPNRPGRHHCVACGEPLAASERPPGATLPGPGIPESTTPSAPSDSAPAVPSAPADLPGPSQPSGTLPGLPQAAPAPGLARPKAPEGTLPGLPQPRPEELKRPASPATTPDGTLLGIPQRPAPASGTSPDAPSPELRSEAPSEAPPELAPPASPSPEVPPPAQPSASAAPAPLEPVAPAPVPLADAPLPPPAPSEGGAPSEAASPSEAAAPAAPEAPPPAGLEAPPPPIDAAAFEKASTVPFPASQVPLPGSTVPLPASAVPRPPEQVHRPVTPTLPPDSKGSSALRKVLWTLAGLVFVGALSAGGYYLWSTQFADRNTPLHVPSEVRLTGLDATPPTATVELLVPAGAEVRLDGRTLEKAPASSSSGSQRLTHVLELGPVPREERSEVELVERSVPLEVTAPNRPAYAGSVVLRAPATPLRLLGPGPRVVLGSGRLIVSGTTAPGARVQAGPSTTRADAQGRFSLPLPSAAPGELMVTASVAEHLPRAVAIRIEKAAGAPPAATPFSSLATRLGERVRVDGQVSSVRSMPEGTHVTLRVTQGCPTTRCEVTALLPFDFSTQTSSSRPRVGQESTLVGDVAGGGTSPHLRAEALLPR